MYAVKGSCFERFEWLNCAHISTWSHRSLPAVTEWRKKWERNNDWLTSERKPVENKDLFQVLFQLIDSRPGPVKMVSQIWIERYVDDPSGPNMYNNLLDTYTWSYWDTRQWNGRSTSCEWSYAKCTSQEWPAQMTSFQSSNIRVISWIRHYCLLYIRYKRI